jgi:hypothetical protein
MSCVFSSIDQSVIYSIVLGSRRSLLQHQLVTVALHVLRTQLVRSEVLLSFHTHKNIVKFIHCKLLHHLHVIVQIFRDIFTEEIRPCSRELIFVFEKNEEHNHEEKHTDYQDSVGDENLDNS